uniref:Uncharacterized protein n=2 Tax=Spongospora subterranea TaxID=70186 RepID=A0A0H5QXI5_9EUKA|eukprot:CRZ06331.1 hypothetical protein [Spongospora subterranea]
MNITDNNWDGPFKKINVYILFMITVPRLVFVAAVVAIVIGYLAIHRTVEVVKWRPGRIRSIPERSPILNTYYAPVFHQIYLDFRIGNIIRLFEQGDRAIAERHLNSVAAKPEDKSRLWMVVAIAVAKKRRWSSLTYALGQPGVKSDPVMATIYLMTSKSNPTIRDQIWRQLTPTAMALVILYARERDDRIAIAHVLQRVPKPLPIDVRTAAGKVLLSATNLRDIDLVMIVKQSAFYWDLEYAIQAAVKLGDLSTLTTIAGTDRTRYQNAALVAMATAIEMEKTDLFWEIAKMFNLEGIYPDKGGFISMMLDVWYFVPVNIIESMLDSAKERVKPVVEPQINMGGRVQAKLMTAIANNDDDFLRRRAPTLRSGTLGKILVVSAIRGDLMLMKAVMPFIQIKPRLLSTALVIAAGKASEHRQRRIVHWILHQINDLGLSQILANAVIRRDYRLINDMIDAVGDVPTVMFNTEIGRALEYAFLNDDSELISVLLRLPLRNHFTTIGKRRAVLYAARNGRTDLIDLILSKSTIRDLKHVNVLLLDVLGGLLETERYDDALRYWRHRHEWNWRVHDLSSATFENWHYESDSDRVGHPDSLVHRNHALSIILHNRPLLETLRELLEKVAAIYSFHVDRAEQRLEELKSSATPFWSPPDRDPIQRNVDYVPNFMRSHNPSARSGWAEVGRMLLHQVKETAKKTAKDVGQTSGDLIYDLIEEPLAY